MGFSCRGLAASIVVLSLLSGCSLFKRGDASDPSTSSSAKVVRKLASEMAPQTNLVRNSGPVLLLRLRKLFPGAPQAVSDGVPSISLSKEDFDTMKARGANVSLAALERPFNSLAQVALRTKVSELCKNASYADRQIESSIYSEKGILLAGETLPDDEASSLALTVARNVWLTLYTVKDPEVQELAELYRGALAKGTADQARSMVCMGAILAPQFWIGNADPTNALRQASLEIGRRLPTFSELDDYRKKKFTLGEFVQRLQNDPNRGTGYLAAVKEWHRNWLGLRPAYVDEALTDIHIWDPRPVKSGISGGMTVMTTGQEIPEPGEPTLQSSASVSAFAEEPCDRNKAQAFDPRTTILIWEVRNPLSSAADTRDANGMLLSRGNTTVWESAAAWVHTGAVAQFKSLMRTKYPELTATSVNTWFTANCALNSSFSARGYSSSLPQYYLCKGRVTRDGGGGYVATELQDLRTDGPGNNPARNPGILPGQLAYYPKSRLATYAGKPEADLVSALGDTASKYYYSDERRFRRYSPSGVQDGVSQFKRWYTDSPGLACNGVSRYFLTCAYRPPDSSWLLNADTYWNADLPGILYSSIPDYDRRISGANPYVLNQFRCGLPNKAGLAAAASSGRGGQDLETFEESILSRGYNPATYTDPNVPTGLNSLSSAADVSADAYYTPSGPENRAVTQLQHDLDDEPYNLLEFILTNNRPYSEFFTAEYTRGREELELYYRSQGHQLPLRPEGYSLNAPGSAARNQMRTIEFRSMPGIPLSWIRSSFDDYPSLQFSSLQPTIKALGYIPPKRAAGLLTMPAFLMPVLPSMRTLSSRYFNRLLCGAPNVYTMGKGEAAIHERYMSSTTNKFTTETARQHLDQKTSCYQCHINMDPLAQALGANFLNYVQSTEYDAKLMESMGEMDSTLPGVGQVAGMYGTRYGGEVSTGAFLGAEVTGVQGVARQMVSHRLWGKCVVQKAFENVFGRSVTLADVPDYNSLVDRFMQHKDYNLMIQQMVDTPGYTKNN